ncbi:MAG: serine--tRNA ligase, partial [Actinomycetota bacterium]|nr:serine--tRNA ligase [Actinomycetota bacterium]
MIDLRVLRDEPDLVRDSLAARGMPLALADELLAADAARRAAVTSADRLRSEQKAASKVIGAASKDERPAMLAAAQDLASQVKTLEEQERVADAALRTAHLAVPNLVEDGVPPGGEDDSVVLEKIGEVPTYNFEPRDHVEIGTALRAIDIERGAKVSGARFYFLTGVGAELEFALANLAMAQARETGFTPMIAPSLVRPEAMEGTGFLGAHADEVYRLAADDLY